MKPRDFFVTRREMLSRCGMGMGAVALNALLGEAGHLQAATAQANPLAPKKPPLPAKAKRVLHLFMNGGVSHVDTFDPKPSLAKFAGKPIPITLKTERRTGAAFPSPFAFRKFGQSGTEVSEVFSQVGGCVDDLCIVRSMHTDIPNHEPSLMMMNCGDVRQVRPSFGSWVTYGLGSENENLPGFIVLCPDGLPTQGNQNWRSAFLPGAYQATQIDTRETQIEKLIENIRNGFTTATEQRRQLDLLAELNGGYQERRQNDALLEARVQSFELAYRMQMEADDAFDLSKEPEHVHKLYGDGLQARQMMIARRLLERGVRFVQAWSGAGMRSADSSANQGSQAAWHAGGHACDLGRRVWAHADGRVAGLRGELGYGEWARPQPLWLFDVACGRRTEKGHRVWRYRRVRVRRRREQSTCPRFARHAASPPGL